MIELDIDSVLLRSENIGAMFIGDPGSLSEFYGSVSSIYCKLN